MIEKINKLISKQNELNKKLNTEKKNIIKLQEERKEAIQANVVGSGKEDVLHDRRVMAANRQIKAAEEKVKDLEDAIQSLIEGQRELVEKEILPKIKVSAILERDSTEKTYKQNRDAHLGMVRSSQKFSYEKVIPAHTQYSKNIQTVLRVERITAEQLLGIIRDERYLEFRPLSKLLGVEDKMVELQKAKEKELETEDSIAQKIQQREFQTLKSYKDKAMAILSGRKNFPDYMKGWTVMQFAGNLKTETIKLGRLLRLKKPADWIEPEKKEEKEEKKDNRTIHQKNMALAAQLTISQYKKVEKEIDTGVA